MAKKLTDNVIAKLKEPGKYYDHHRDAPRGFGVRVRKSGTKTFFFRYQGGGIDRMATIGEFGTWTLAGAREEARNLRREYDRGVDVLEEARAERMALTFAHAAERYLSNRTDRFRTGKAIRSAFERELIPALGNKKLADVTRGELIALVEAKALGAPKKKPPVPPLPRAAGKLLSHLKAFFAWAMDRELVQANPAAGIRPARIDKSIQARRRGRVLDDQELRTFWNEVETCGMSLQTALALKLVLLTGQRPGEVAGMRWSEIDDDTWTIPAARRGKTGDDHEVPLTGTAIRLLEQARNEAERLAVRRKREPGDAVFESWTGKPLTPLALPRAASRFAEELGNNEHGTWGYWTPHDLRRTCRTGLSACGIPEEIAERVIGHVRNGIVGVYDRHRYEDEKRRALEAWELRVAALGG